MTDRIMSLGDRCNCVMQLGYPGYGTNVPRGTLHAETCPLRKQSLGDERIAEIAKLLLGEIESVARDNSIVQGVLGIADDSRAMGDSLAAHASEILNLLRSVAALTTLQKELTAEVAALKRSVDQERMRGDEWKRCYEQVMDRLRVLRLRLGDALEDA
jgi:hypothetical protein